MLKKSELATRVQMGEYLCSSWKKYKRCHVGDHFQLAAALLCEKWSRGAWQFLSTICRGSDCTMLWGFQTKPPEPARDVSVISTWCSAVMTKLVFLMEYHLYKTSDASFSVNHINVGKIIWLQSVQWHENVCFFPFQIHQQKHMKCHFGLAVEIHFHHKPK